MEYRTMSLKRGRTMPLTISRNKQRHALDVGGLRKHIHRLHLDQYHIALLLYIRRYLFPAQFVNQHNNRHGGKHDDAKHEEQAAPTYAFQQ